MFKSCISSTLLKLPQGLSVYPPVFHENWEWKGLVDTYFIIFANARLLHTVFLEVCPVFNDSSKGAPTIFLQRLLSIIKDFTVKKQFLPLGLKYSLADFSIHLYYIYTLYSKSQTAPSYIIQSFKS